MGAFFPVPPNVEDRLIQNAQFTDKKERDKW